MRESFLKGLFDIPLSARNWEERYESFDNLTEICWTKASVFPLYN